MQPADDPVPPDADDKIEPGASSQIATEREGNYDEFPAAASEVETEVRDEFSSFGSGLPRTPFHPIGSIVSKI